MNDFRYAFRTLWKNPGFAIVAVLTLALGIGANTAIFSVINGVLLRPLPFKDVDRVVGIFTTTAQDDADSHSAPDFEDLRRENASFQALAGYTSGAFSVSARPGDPVQLIGAVVTVDFFDVLGLRAIRGRTFSRDRNDQHGERMAVLSEEASRKLFGEDDEATGQRVRIDGEPFTVLGVVPANAEWPVNARIWILSKKEVPPSPIEPPNEATAREIRYFNAIGRLRAGVTLQQAAEDMKRMAHVLEQRGSTSGEMRGLRVSPLREDIVGDVRGGLLVLQAAVGIVLLIACANVSSLLIARASGRQRELAVRAAIGAGRSRLVRQLLAESLLLGLIGGGCGLLLGSWLIVMLVAVLPANVPRASEIRLDWVVAAMTIATAVATGVLFGVMPALQASRADAASALKQTGERGSSGRPRARAALVVAEIALTLTLLAGAGLLLNSFLRLQRVDSGMQPENVTLVPLFLPQSRYSAAAAQIQVFEPIIEGVAARAEIQAAGLGFPGPLQGDNASGTFYVGGRSPDDPGGSIFANLGAVSGGYFKAMGIPLLAGRTFTASDRADTRDVAIVNATLAKRIWPGESAVGKRIRFDRDPDAKSQEVVGVVGDVRHLGLDKAPPPVLYIPYQQFPLPFTNVVVRSTAPPATIAALVRSQIAAVDPELPPGEIRTLQSVFDRSVAQPRFRAFVITAFALLALVLAAVGVFGLVSYSVAQRTREIGIRIALGAQPRQVLAPIVREGLTLAAIGIAIGLAGAVLFARVLSSFLFGVGSTDPVTFAGVSVVLLTVAFLATYVPARRALRVDPMSALRTE